MRKMLINAPARDDLESIDSYLRYPHRQSNVKNVVPCDEE